MKGQPPKGIDALLLAPMPSMPTPRRLMSKRLADNVHGSLTWMEFARARSANTVKGYGEDVRMFVAFCEQSSLPDVDQIDDQRRRSLRRGLARAPGPEGDIDRPALLGAPAVLPVPPEAQAGAAESGEDRPDDENAPAPTPRRS